EARARDRAAARLTAEQRLRRLLVPLARRVDDRLDLAQLLFALGRREPRRVGLRVEVAGLLLELALHRADAVVRDPELLGLDHRGVRLLELAVGHERDGRAADDLLDLVVDLV